jgi:hypothetical protein
VHFYVCTQFLCIPKGKNVSCGKDLCHFWANEPQILYYFQLYMGHRVPSMPLATIGMEAWKVLDACYKRQG